MRRAVKQLKTIFPLIILCGTILLSACNGGASNSGTSGVPTAPISTSALFPQDNAINVSTSGLIFTWGAFSGEESLVLQIDTDRTFPGSSVSALVFEETNLEAGVTSYIVPDGVLQGGTNYFWRLIARNSQGDQLYGPFTFMTAGACAATTELCDGVDNDCDGMIDDGVCQCGNGQIESFVFETCDDNNAVAGDGCSATCQPESWAHPSSLTQNISPDGQDTFEPQIAMDNNGNALAVWRQSDGTNQQIFMSEYRNGSWAHPSSLTDNISPNGEDAFGPRVAMDNQGNALIVWRQSDGSNEQVFMSEYRSGSWTHPSSLSDHINPASFSIFGVQVAMDNSGNALIVWNQFDVGNQQVFMSEYRNGSWTHPASINDNISPGGEDANGPQVAMDDNGNAIVVWEQYDGSEDQTFMSEYRNGSWTHPSSLADNISPNGQDTHDPQVAMDNNGNALIVWRQNAGSAQQVFMSEYRNGSWTHPSSLADNISPDATAGLDPQVAMDNQGNALIVWRQGDGNDDQTFMSEYRNGSWIHPSLLTDNISPDGEDALNAQVAMDNNGNALVVWRQSDGSKDQTFMSEYRGGSWIHPSSLTDNISPDEQNALDAQVAMDDNGNALVVWRQSNGTNQQIFISEYR